MAVEMLSGHLELPKSIQLSLQLVAKIKLLSIDWPLKEEEKNIWISRIIQLVSLKYHRHDQSVLESEGKHKSSVK